MYTVVLQKRAHGRYITFVLRQGGGLIFVTSLHFTTKKHPCLHYPGVQTPEAGGPSTRETLALLRALAPMHVVGADVVETNPLFDGPGQITALLAATVVHEILSLIAAGRGAGPGR